MSKELQTRQDSIYVQLRASYRRAVERVISDLEDKGLLGEHPLVAAPALQTTVAGGVIGKVSSSFLSVSGMVYGEVGSEPMLTFAWKPTNSDKMYVSGVPGSKLSIRRREGEDSGQRNTAVEFLFIPQHFLRIDQGALDKNPAGALTTVEYPRPDHYLKPEALREVIIWATEEDYAQMQSLGFGRSFHS